MQISLPKDGVGAKALCGFKDRSIERKKNPLRVLNTWKPQALLEVPILTIVRSRDSLIVSFHICIFCRHLLLATMGMTVRARWTFN